MNTGVVVVIPARYASTRLPGKPLISLAHKPLIQWVYQRAAQIPNVKRIIVATDHRRIVAAVSSFGGEAILTPSDLNSGSERVAWVAQSLAEEIIINLQGDEPLISTEAVGRAIQFLKDHPEIPAATLGSPLEDRNAWLDPSVVKVLVDADGRALYFTRNPVPHFREDDFRPLPGLMQHIGIYLFRRRFLLEYATWPPAPLEQVEKLEQLRILHRGYTLQVIESGYGSPGVDTPGDVKKVEKLLRQEGKVCDPEDS